MIAGITAAWAIFGMFLAIDHELGLPPGALYERVGLTFGVDQSYALYVGFMLYMITAVIIGIAYTYDLKPCSYTQNQFRSEGPRYRYPCGSNSLGCSFSTY